jgi:hypothetical protein
MVLFNITGELGSGKTLSQTNFLWKNWFYRRRPVFANYHLFKIPYHYVEYVEQFEKMKDGVVGADELWTIVDSRCSKDDRNRLVSSILLKSRKRDLTYFYTAQMLELLDKRIRKIQDFTAYPMLNTNQTVCKVVIFRTGYPKEHHYMKTVYYKTGLVFNMFDTYEEINMKSMAEEMKSETEELSRREKEMVVMANLPPMKIVFQAEYNKEHGYWCQCEKCGTKFFMSWEEADKYAEKYWGKMKVVL